MERRELTKGVIGQILTGTLKRIELENGQIETPEMLMQILEIKEEKALTPPSFTFTLSDGICTCRGIYKGADTRFKDLKIQDVVQIEDHFVTFINGIVIVLTQFPSVIDTNVDRTIGDPIDYAQLALNVATAKKEKINTKIPTEEEMKQQVTAGHGNRVIEVESDVTLLSELRREMIVFKIKVRVTKIHDQRTCKNGLGKLQKVDLIDQEGTEIGMMLFDEGILFHGNVLKEGEVFYITNGKIRDANRQYSAIAHEFTIFADKRTTVEPTMDDKTIPSSIFKFVEFEELRKYINLSVDVIGQVIRWHDYPARDGGLDKKEITLSNGNGTEINATLWKGKGSDIDFSVKPVIAMKMIYVKEYSGKVSLTSHDDTVILIDPQEHRAEEPKPAPVEEDKEENFPEKRKTVYKELQNFRTLIEIMNEGETIPNFLTISCVIKAFRDTFYYIGCPNCMKKGSKNEIKGKCMFCQAEYQELDYIYNFTKRSVVKSQREKGWKSFHVN